MRVKAQPRLEALLRNAESQSREKLVRLEAAAQNAIRSGVKRA
jgi:hypothetical protein